MNETGTKRVSWNKQTRTFTRRHLQQLSRDKMILFLTVAWPVLWYFLTMEFFVDVPAGTDLGPLKAANGINYGLFGAFTVTVAVFAGEFARDLSSNRYRKLRTMPISPTADLTGRFVAGAALGVASYLVTIVAAYAHGGAFGTFDVETIAILSLTLLSFCLIAMALAMVLALAITKPEQMTTIAIVIVLMAYFVTGFNGTSPGMLADGAEIVNYLPNSLATRMQIGVWMGTADLDFMTPPEVPTSITHVGLLVGYSIVLLITSIAIVRRVAYGGD